MKKQRYLVQRLDTEEFFCHPSEVEEFTQWIKDPLRAHKWVDLDSCLAAVRTSDMVGNPAQVHTSPWSYDQEGRLFRDQVTVKAPPR